MTADEAIAVKDLIGSNKNIILVTSAFHMNRSIFIGEKNNWKFIPYAVDFSQPIKFQFIPSINILSNFSTVQHALHEWVGLIAYYLMGRTNRII